MDKIRVTTSEYEYMGLEFGSTHNIEQHCHPYVYFKANGKDWTLDLDEYEWLIVESLSKPTDVNTPCSKTQQYTGGSSDYYKILVKNPTTLEKPYEAEANDIIEALEMDFAEGNAFKAIWRKARARQGVKKKGYDNGVYDSEKVIFFGERMLIKAKDKDNESV